MTIALPHQKIKLSDNTVRRSLMVLLAFIMTHLITYQQVPFSSNYQFPWIPFSIFLIYGLFICETNTWNYRRLSSKSKLNYDHGSVWLLIKTNIFYCTIIFSILSILQMVIFQYIMNPFRFVGLLGVCLMISLIETGVFILRGYSKKNSLTLNKLAASTAKLSIVRNGELRTVDEVEIAYFMHQNGCVFMVDHDGNKIVTQYETLNELEEKLSLNFFRANRQTIISKTAIASVQKDVNNKLKLQLKHLSDSISVSRYKSPELKHWLSSDHSA
ncbi:LytTR family transcriptional regulator DNA-binding domain-containing protein [Ekhidna sp. To15]|uniref:LytTR family transcriptional regulator DNA-binding domain-containing protein n=1 Tax=Ekhidna sp. To15 TaxID=3395267 RepID=UPI003F526E4B